METTIAQATPIERLHAKYPHLAAEFAAHRAAPDGQSLEAIIGTYMGKVADHLVAAVDAIYVAQTVHNYTVQLSSAAKTTLDRILQGELHPELAACYTMKPAIRNKVERLPLEMQEKIVRGEPFRVAEGDTHRLRPLNNLKHNELHIFNRVIDVKTGKERTEAQQRALDVEMAAKKREREQRRADTKWRIDRAGSEPVAILRRDAVLTKAEARRLLRDLEA